MRAQPIALEQAQDHSSTPRLLPLSKGMGLACQTVQSVRQHPVQAFFVNRIGTLDGLAQHLVYLDTHHLAPATMLDGLGQSNPRGGHQARSAPFAKALRVQIHPLDLAPVYLSSVTDSWHAPLARCPLPRLGHHPGSRLILRGGKGPSHPEAPGPIPLTHPQRGPIPADALTGSAG